MYKVIYDDLLLTKTQKSNAFSGYSLTFQNIIQILQDSFFLQHFMSH